MCLPLAATSCIPYAASGHMPRSLEFKIRDTYNWLSNSAVRRAEYKIYGLINDGMAPLKLVQLCQTRWMPTGTAGVRILQQWTELMAHFELYRKQERCYIKKNEAAVQDPTKPVNDLVHLIDFLCPTVVIPCRKMCGWSSWKLFEPQTLSRTWCEKELLQRADFLMEIYGIGTYISWCNFRSNINSAYQRMFVLSSSCHLWVQMCASSQSSQVS